MYKRQDGIIVINKGIYAIILTLSDIIDHLEKINEISERDNVNSIFEKTEKSFFLFGIKSLQFSNNS